MLKSLGSAARMRPGRFIAGVAALVIALASVVGLARVGQRSAVPLASNGVGVGAVIAVLNKPGDRLCLSPAVAPAGTAAVELWVAHDDPRPVTLSGTLQAADGRSLKIAPTRLTSTVGFQLFPLSGVIDREVRARLCVVRGGAGRHIDIAGANVIRRKGEAPASINGHSLGQVEPSLHFYDRGRPLKSGITRIGAVLDHLSALSPSGMSPLAIGLLLAILVPGSLLLLVWNLATAPRRSARRVAALCVIASLGLTVTWATITPMFQGPDEPEHFAYAQRLAATGHRADASRLSTRPPYSTQELQILSLLHNNAVVIDRAARQPWTQTTRRDVDAAANLPRGDGGGFTESASGHSALYYALLSPAIKLAGRGLPLQLYFARLTTALMASLIAGLAAWAAAIAVPGRRRVAALSGLAAATIPIAGSVHGTVNNDALVNLCAAAAFVVVVSVLRSPRAAPWRFALLGALVILLPVAKISGVGLMLAFGGALVVAALMRRRLSEIAAALLAGVGGAVAAIAVLAACAELLVTGQPLVVFNVHPTIPSLVVPGPPIPLMTRADYILQLFFPFIHLRSDLYPTPVPLYRIYILGTWGGFGWNRAYLPTSLNLAIGAATAVAVVAGIAGLVRERARMAGHKLVALAIALTPIIAITFVAYAYTGPTGRDTQPEQGRYLMIALAPLSLWFAAVPAALPSGPARSAATGTIAGLLCTATLAGLLVATIGWAA